MFAQKKIYLSLSQSRQLASEYPIGDPFGGPAYGKKELFGLIAGAAAIFEGVTAWGAATTLISTIAAGAAIVGGALTIVGTLTGDANLTQIGGIIGLGGAAISLATGGWEAMSAEFSSWFGDSAAAASDVAGLGQLGSGTYGMDIGGVGLLQSTPAPGIATFGQGTNLDLAGIGGGAGVAGGEVAASVAPSTMAAFGPTPSAGPSFLTDTAAIDSAVGNVGASPIAPDPTVTQAIQQSGAMGTTGTNEAAGAVNAAGQSVAGGAAGAPGAAGEASQSGVSKFFKENSELVKMLGQGTASLFERVSPSEKSKAETLAMKANAGATDARAELDRWTLQLKQQQANNANTVVSPGLLTSPTAGNVTRGGTNSYMPRTTYMPA